MKEANIIPVPKIKRPKTNADFRPLSIQSSLSKIFEIIMLDQTETFIQISQPFDHQFGFRPGRSTVCLLRKCNINIVHNMNSGHLTILILLDFSKAFDTIAHGILKNCVKLASHKVLLVFYCLLYTSPSPRD